MLKKSSILIGGLLAVYLFLLQGCNHSKDQGQLNTYNKTIIGKWYNVGIDSDKMEFLSDNTGTTSNVGFKWTILDDQRVKVEMQSGQTILLGKLVNESGLELLKFEMKKGEAIYSKDIGARDKYQVINNNSLAISEGRNIKTALEAYFSDNNKYPVDLFKIYNVNSEVVVKINYLTTTKYKFSIQHNKGDSLYIIESDEPRIKRIKDNKESYL